MPLPISIFPLTNGEINGESEPDGGLKPNSFKNFSFVNDVSALFIFDEVIT